MDLKLKVVQLKPYNQYVLLDEASQKTFSLVLEFYGVKSPQINDFLVLNEKLLDQNFEGYCEPYAFTPLEDSDEIRDESELSGLICSGEKYVLKRVYG